MPILFYLLDFAILFGIELTIDGVASETRCGRNPILAKIAFDYFIA
jgi:hypothetical protein